jgi:hypothetical protein
MTPRHRWTRQLFGIWQIAVALIAIATVSHDLTMAAHFQVDMASAQVGPDEAAHVVGEEQDHRTQASALAAYRSTPDPGCPPDSCPQQIDCGLERVSNPVSPPDLLAGNAAAHDSRCLESRSDSGISSIAIAPLHPPGIRRALLQVYLN